MDIGDRVRIVDHVGMWDENEEHTGITGSMLKYCGKCGQVVEKINTNGALDEDASMSAPVYIYVLDIDSGRNFWLEDWLELI